MSSRSLVSRLALAGLLLASVTATVTLSGCGEGAEGPVLDPFGVDDGKADGVGGSSSFFGPGKVHGVSLTGVAGGTVLGTSATPRQLTLGDDSKLVVQGPKGTGSFKRLELTSWKSANDQRSSLRIKLRKGDTLAGQKQLLLVPMDGDATRVRALVASLLAAQTGVAVPRVAHARLTLDGIDRGLYVVVEHPDQSFLDRAFGSSAEDGRVIRSDEPLAGAEVDLLAARLNVLPYPGTRALSSVLDLEATAGLLAALAALGDPVDHGEAAGPGPSLHLANACEEDAPCLTPLLDPASVGPAATGAADRRQLVADLRDRVLRLPAARAAYATAVQTLVDCLGAPSCSRDPISRALGALAPALGAAGAAAAQKAVTAELLPALDARAAQLGEWLARERDADAPDGHADYASFSRDDDGTLSVRFRHLTPGEHASAVSVLIRTSRTGRETAIPLERDADLDLWTSAIDVGGGTFYYRFAVDTASGRRLEVTDPARSAPASAGQHALDPDEVDVLVPVHTVKLDVAEPSDLAIADGQLYTVSDKNPNIYRIDPETGRRLQKIDAPGRDLEALAFDPLYGMFLLADETRDHLWQLDGDGEKLGEIDVRNVEDGNSGIEGLAIRHEDGHIFVGKEKNPDRIVELDADGVEVRRATVGFAHDLSALGYSDDEARLYSLSQEDGKLFRLSPDLRVERSFKLDLEGAEGVAFDRERVYVVTDAKAELHVYTLNAWRYQ